MEKREEERTQKKGTSSGGVLSVLMGTAIGLLLLLLFALLSAALIWGGLVPEEITHLLLTVAAGLCPFVAGRVAIQKGSGGPPMAIGGGIGLLLCGILVPICWGTTGAEGFHGPFVGILLMTMAGGCLAGLLGRKTKRKKKKR